jgi:hypothetical protein
MTVWIGSGSYLIVASEETLFEAVAKDLCSKPVLALLQAGFYSTAAKSAYSPFARIRERTTAMRTIVWWWALASLLGEESFFSN